MVERSKQVTAGTDTQQALGRLRRFWCVAVTIWQDRRVRRLRFAMWAAAVVMCGFAFLHAVSTSPDFQRAKDASHALAESFGGLTPAAFTNAFEQRRMRCDYRWLFFCDERASPKIRDSEFVRCVISHPRNQMSDCYSPFEGLRDGFSRAAAFPDAAVHLLLQNFTRDWLSGTMTALFVALIIVFNLPVVAKAPIFVAITFPVTLAFASGLYWLLESIFLAGAFLAYLAYGLALWMVACSHSVLHACEGVAKTTEVKHLGHEARQLWQQLAQFVTAAGKLRV
jgi:hypothetical protein